MKNSRGRRFCSRRRFLKSTAVAGGALAVPGFATSRAEKSATGARQRDTAVIQIWLGGGPSQLDMYDLKPDAPSEIRGPFRPIATSVPGVQICELLPQQAKLFDRLSIVRSLHHTTNDHHAGIHWMQTGHLGPVFGVNLSPTRPSTGAVVARVRGANRSGTVPYVHIGPDAKGFDYYVDNFDSAYFGPRYSPLWIKSKGQDPAWGKVGFEVPNFKRNRDIGGSRMAQRLRLLKRLDTLHGQLGTNHVMDSIDEYHRQAAGLIASPAMQAAFRVQREPDAVRDRYGRNAWGQGALLCRRLVEAGVTFVTLNTDAFSGAWDNHLKIEKDYRIMLPIYDRMLSALIDDLVLKGLYERVVVLVWGEFGRTPKINRHAGRDHWGAANFALIGGGGLRGGTVVGKTNAHAEEPISEITTPGDVWATIYQVLGIDQEIEFPDRSGRPLRLLNQGNAIASLI